MRKYWKLITFVVMIGVTIAVFYVQSAFSSKAYPDFAIQKHEGAEKAIESMTLTGYYSDLHFVFDDIFITQKGSTYNRENGYIQPEKEIKDLQKRYRNFMRGKSQDPNSYIENEQYLIYADTVYNYLGYTDQFHISVLNKETKDSQSYYRKIPEHDQFTYAYLEKIKLINNQLYLITQSDIDEENETTSQLKSYIFDLDKEDLVSNEIIAETKYGMNSYENFNIMEDAQTKNEDTIVFQRVLQKYNEEYEETISQDIIIYDPSTGEQQKIELSDEIIELGSLVEMDGSTLYFIKNNGENIDIFAYDYEKKVKDKVTSVKSIGNTDKEQGYVTKLKDQKLYIVNSYKDVKMSANMIALDLKNKELLYRGELMAKDMNEPSDRYELYISDISFK